MDSLVTIGLPIYKRLEHLPRILSMVREQDYPNIELLVSDNGMNSTAVPEIVSRQFLRPFKFRQNPSIADMPTHWNQIIAAASGKYFMMLCDDDEISPNFVSELVSVLEHYPEASFAISKQESINESGMTISESTGTFPNVLTGAEFIRAAWHTYQFKFASFTTILARTELLKACGGYPDFCKGHSHDDALMIKLCLNNYVAFAPRCTFRKRVYETSHGLSIAIEEIAEATRQLFEFLDSDPRVKQFAYAHPTEWKKLKAIVGRMNWECYYVRWKGLYKQRLTPFEWLKAAFALPFVPGYYLRVACTLGDACKGALASRAKKVLLTGAKA